MKRGHWHHLHPSYRYTDFGVAFFFTECIISPVHVCVCVIFCRELTTSRFQSPGINRSYLKSHETLWISNCIRISSLVIQLRTRLISNSDPNTLLETSWVKWRLLISNQSRLSIRFILYYLSSNFWSNPCIPRRVCRRQDNRARRICCRTRQYQSASIDLWSSASAAHLNHLDRRPCHLGRSRRINSCRRSAESKPRCSPRSSRPVRPPAVELCFPFHLHYYVIYCSSDLYLCVHRRVREQG